MAQIDEIVKARQEKLGKAQQLGWSPYTSKFEKHEDIRYALENEGEKVQTAGRIVSFREHGNIAFADLRDPTGKIQVFFKKDSIGKEAFKNLRLLDIGDFLGVVGEVGKTNAGEISIIPEEYTLLTKSMLPLPNEWFGLKDTETRYRKRYLDLILNQDVKEIFETRSKVVTLLRHYMDKHGFLEVETPVLQPIYGGASAKPFTTHYNALDAQFYLRIAVELYLKRLVVGGIEKVYEMGKNFRNEGFSRQHNPEFTMLEFYWAYADYNDLMKFTEDMLTTVIKELKGTSKVLFEGEEYDFSPPWPRKSFHELYQEYLNIDLAEYNTEEKFDAIIKERNLLDEEVIGYARKLDEVYKKHIRPQLKGPLFLVDHPVELKPLAKRREDDPSKSAGFQLLVAGMEFINAYNELNDPQDQKARWEEDMKVGKRGGDDFQVLDEDYIEALSYGMPPTAGWGMGIDRLVAFLTNQHAIKDVILFPTMKPNIEGQAGDVAEAQEDTGTDASDDVVDDSDEDTNLSISRDDALAIVEEHTKNNNLVNHMKAVEATMRALARKLGGNEDLWGMAGLLHDADWEKTQDDASQHTHKTIQWLKEAGEENKSLVDLILTHNFTHNGHRGPRSKGEWALYTCDELTGFIVAVALVRPDKKLGEVKVKSVLKKFPAKAFAKPVDREQIKMCEDKLGIPLEEFVELTLNAMKEISDEIGL